MLPHGFDEVIVSDTSLIEVVGRGVIILVAGIDMFLKRIGPLIFIGHLAATAVELCGADADSNLVTGHVITRGVQTLSWDVLILTLTSIAEHHSLSGSMTNLLTGLYHPILVEQMDFRICEHMILQ